MPSLRGAVVVLVLLGVCVSLRAADPHPDPLDAATWIARCPDADRVLADPAAVARHNRRMLDLDPSVNDLTALPPTLDRAAVVDRVRRRGTLPKGPLVLGDGTPVPDDARSRWVTSLVLDDLPDTIAPRFGLVVRRSALRRFPTRERVHASARVTDIDQFQESAFFPGTPVAAVHATPDGAWCYVIGPTYDAWMESDAIGFGDRDAVLAYAAEASRVVVATRAETVFVPDMPAISRLALDMGTTLPEARTWPPSEPVHGQSPAGCHVVRLPTREADGTLRVVPALVPRSAGTHDGPLPAMRATVLRQTFAFLGELAATPIPAGMPHGDREAAVRDLLPGDLVFTGRHVMMVVGRDGHGTWVIHDTHDGRVDGASANGVVVQPLRSAVDGRALDAVTAVVRVLPIPTPPSPMTP